MQRERVFYHVTAVECVESILRDGLKGTTTPRNRGSTVDTPSIFVLTENDDNLTARVAITQIWPHKDIAEYAVIGIDTAGITGRVVVDNVMESVASFHRIIEQDIIAPQHLKLAKIRQLDYPATRIGELLQSFLKRKWTTEEWTLARTWCDGLFLLGQEFFESGGTATPKGRSD